MRLLRVLFPLMILLLAAQSLRAGYCTGREAWVPVGGGLQGEVITMTEFNGELYAIYSNQTVKPAFTALMAWNGSFWRTVSQIWASSGTGFRMTVYNGSLYLTGSFRQINNAPGTQGIARWNGTAWESVGYGLNGAVRHAVVYRGEIYVFGGFTVAGTIRTQKGARYDGTAWKAFNEIPEGEISEVLVYNDRILARGEALRASGAEYSSLLLAWDGTAWSSMSAGIDAIQYGTGNLVVCRNQLYMLGNITMEDRLRRMVLYDGARWQARDIPDSIPTSNAFLAGFDDRLFITRPNRADAFTGGIWTWDGSNWARLSEFDDAWAKQWFVKYRGEVYAYGSFTKSCGAPVENVAKLCTDGACNRISGSVYRDVNGDCRRDANEPFLANRAIKILPGPIYTFTDKNGAYAVNVGAGSYTVSLIPDDREDLNCPAGSRSVPLERVGEYADSVDFAVQMVAGISDLRIGLAIPPIRPGRFMRCTIRVENTGSVQSWSAVTLEYDSALTYLATSLRPSRAQKGWVEWKVNPVGGETAIITIDLTIPASFPPGAEICVKGTVEPGGGGDIVPRDNSLNLCEQVSAVGSNDISVTPPGLKDEGTYRLTRSDTVLDYLIRFTNTAEDTAFTVIVTDTLDTSLLDPATLKPGIASHPYTLTMTPEGALRFTFDNTRLPRRKEHDSASRGFLRYSARLRPGLRPGTIIPNRAHIFFGYGPPVETNTVISILEGISSTPDDGRDIGTTSIYPNPATTRLRIEGEIRKGSVVTLSTLLGVEAARWESDGGSSMLLDLSAIRPGTYFLRVETPAGTSIRSLNIVR